MSHNHDNDLFHYSDIIMSMIVSQITGVSIVCSTICSKKTSKLCVTGLCEGNPPVIDGFPSQRASNMQNISIWWHHHIMPNNSVRIGFPDNIVHGTNMGPTWALSAPDGPHVGPMLAPWILLSGLFTLAVLYLTLKMRGPSYPGMIMSVSCLLMPWLLASPGHHQQWYWLCKIGRYLPYTTKDFNHLCHVNIEEW